MRHTLIALLMTALCGISIAAAVTGAEATPEDTAATAPHNTPPETQTAAGPTGSLTPSVDSEISSGRVQSPEEVPVWTLRAEMLKAEPNDLNRNYVRGKDALNRIEELKPAWSEANHGVEFGIAIVGERRRFPIGQRIPLQFFVRNVSDKTLAVSLAADFIVDAPDVRETKQTPDGPAHQRLPYRVPEVRNAKGESMFVAGAMPLSDRIQIAERLVKFLDPPAWFTDSDIVRYREVLKPGEAFCFSYPSLGLGESPKLPSQMWHPYWAKPVPGRYTLRYTHSINVEPIGADYSISGDFTTGEIEFNVVNAANAGAADDAASSEAASASDLADSSPHVIVAQDDDPLLNLKDGASAVSKLLHLVRLIVGPDKLTFEGRETTWDALLEHLKKILGDSNRRLL